jgi:hypothetical protein
VIKSLGTGSAPSRACARLGVLRVDHVDATAALAVCVRLAANSERDAIE